MDELAKDFEGRVRAAYAPAEAVRIVQALDWARLHQEGRFRASGEPSWLHDLRVAAILVELGLDADSVAAGLLHDALDLPAEPELLPPEDRGAEPLEVPGAPHRPAAEPGAAKRRPPAERLAGERHAGERRLAGERHAGERRLAEGPAAAALAEELAREFGEDCLRLVRGVSKLAALKANNKTVQAAESIRKMLFAMTEDIRVILVKLADKLDNMRTLKYLPEERQKEIATECLDIFAPLADRLGVSGVKDELEDLSLKALNREAFDQIKAIVAGKKVERESYLVRVEAAIKEAARAEGVELEITARAKHFYSIYQKMRKKAKTAEELFDLLGIRIITATENDCYAVLGMVHRIWKPIEGRFKDYVAMPKANGYRSLHTTVMGFEGRLLEVQIRTRDMHRVAEFGVASHWLYKKGSTAELPKAEDLPLVNRLKDWSGFLSSGGEFLEEIKRELLKDSIFVFTPRGDVIELPAGAGPLDFAYAIHSDVGNRCVGAKADGQIVSLDGELKNTQIVEILTSPAAHPTMNWLPLAKTSKARSKIRAWLVQSGQVLAIEKGIAAGKKAPAAEKAEEGKARKAEHEEKAKAEEQKLGPVSIHPAEGTVEFRNYTPGEAVRNEKAGVAVGGQRGLMIRIAGCCRPVTGDPIVGYVSRGRGIIVHRADCRSLAAVPDVGERRIEVRWESVLPFVTARFRLTARRSAELFSEIEAAVRKFRGRLREGRLGERGDGVFSGSFTMEVETREDVKKVLRAVRSIPSVLSIEEDE